MASTSVRNVIKAWSVLLLASMATAQGSLNAMKYEGCFSSAGDMTDYGSYTYQTPGYCQQQCVNAGKPVMGTKGGSDCWCGDLLPDSSDKTSDSSCSSKCNGFGSMSCGGPSSWSVQLTGTNYNVGSVSGSSSGSSSSSDSNSDSDSEADSDSAAPSSAPTTPAAQPASSAPAQSSPAAKASPAQSKAPSVVTHASTIVVTAPGQTQAETTVITTTDTPAKKGPNVAGIAAGVVVGVVALAAIAGVIFFLLRSRKRKMVEELHRNSMGTSGWYGSKPHTSSAGTSSVPDSRLESSVMMQRRQSDVSIADNQDYSRRILKVTNPDGS